MTQKKLMDDISNKVRIHYLRSSEFNGISFQSLREHFKIEENELKKILIELLKHNQITFTFSSIFINPYIKAFKDLSIDKQLELLESESIHDTCIYPSTTSLEKFINVDDLRDTPYTKRLSMGEPQFEPVYFELSVLENFFNDPRFSVQNDDYSGSIYVKSEYDEEISEKDKINLETFGLAYNESLERVTIVYLRYLNKLSAEQQQFWKRYEYKGTCNQNRDYLRNTLGYWSENVSIFLAFIEELHHINEMTQIIGKPKLFRHDFKENRPKEFSIFLRPTLKNYNSFILSLDKLLSENLNKEFFKGEITLDLDIEREDGKIEVRNKGTIALLEEWITKNFTTSDSDPLLKMFTTFKKVRKERQKPAHAIQEDVFDKKYFKMQDEIIINAYSAVRTLRLMLANHPKLKEYKVPTWLFEGKVILH